MLNDVFVYIFRIIGWLSDYKNPFCPYEQKHSLIIKQIIIIFK